MAKSPKDQEVLTSIGQACEFLKAHSIDQKIRHNVRTNKYELDGNELNLDAIDTHFYENYNVNITSCKLISAITYYGDQNEYDPFLEVLEKIKEDIPATSKEVALETIKYIAKEVLGVTDPLYLEYLRVFGIGLVARIYEPACKHDDALILQGKQGLNKSTFFRVLVGDKFFTDRLQGDIANKDQIALIVRYVVLEWSELDRQFGRDRTESIKAGMRAQYDDYRPAYGRENKRNPRRSVFVGTTNEFEFLTDKTGNRTFHIVRINRTINLEKLQQTRLDLLRAFITLYDLGVPHYLDTEELKLAQEADVRDFEKLDPWLEDIEKYVNKRLEINPDDWFLSREFLEEGYLSSNYPNGYVLGNFSDAKNDKSSQMRLGIILRQLGLERKQKRIGKDVFKAWFKN